MKQARREDGADSYLLHTPSEAVELLPASSRSFHPLRYDKSAKKRGELGRRGRVEGCAVVVPTHLSALR